MITASGEATIGLLERPLPFFNPKKKEDFSIFQPDPETVKQVIKGSLVYAKYMVESHKKLFPNSQPEYFEMCGGAVVFVSPTSPLTQLIGFGVTQPVLPEDIAFLKKYFQDRGVPLRIRVTQFTHPSLFECFAGRKYKTTDFTFMLSRTVEKDFIPTRHPNIEVRPIENEQLWVKTFADGHCDGKLDEQTEQLARTLFHAAGSQVLGAWVDGEIAGVAMLSSTGGVEVLNAACTLPAFRNRGIQKAFIEHRLAIAAKHGSNLAMTRVSPGSTSHRNYMKLGFHIGYFTMLLEELD
jgi:GNAT superfamily N-acetyltransferase